jgi:hypothetical protein
MGGAGEKGPGYRRHPGANRFLAALVGNPDGVEATFQLLAFVSHGPKGVNTVWTG